MTCILTIVTFGVMHDLFMQFNDSFKLYDEEKRAILSSDCIIHKIVNKESVGNEDEDGEKVSEEKEPKPADKEVE